MTIGRAGCAGVRGPPIPTAPCGLPIVLGGACDEHPAAVEFLKSMECYIPPAEVRATPSRPRCPWPCRCSGLLVLCLVRLLVRPVPVLKESVVQEGEEGEWQGKPEMDTARQWAGLCPYTTG